MATQWIAIKALRKRDKNVDSGSNGQTIIFRNICSWKIKKIVKGFRLAQFETLKSKIVLLISIRLGVCFHRLLLFIK